MKWKLMVLRLFSNFSYFILFAGLIQRCITQPAKKSSLTMCWQRGLMAQHYIDAIAVEVSFFLIKSILLHSLYYTLSMWLLLHISFAAYILVSRLMFRGNKWCADNNNRKQPKTIPNPIKTHINSEWLRA